MPLIKRGRPETQTAATSPVEGSLAARLVAGNASERWTAARALSGETRAVSALASAVQSEAAAEVRDAIFTSLMMIRTPEAAEALTNLLRSDVAHLRTGALDALDSIVDVARPFLPALLSDADPDVRLLSCELVRTLGGADGTALLCAMLADEQHVNVCGAAVDVLSEVGTASALDVLRQCETRFASDAYLKFAIADAIARVTQRPARDG